MRISRLITAAIFAALASSPNAWLSAARAQDYFIPGQPRAAAPSRPEAPRSAPRAAPRQSVPAPVQVTPPPQPGGEPQAEAEQQAPQVQLPPPPDLPALPKGATPPAAVIGVLGIPEVMRASNAAQQVEKVIGERRERLNADAQKEQGVWRDMQQSLANDRAKLSPEQIRNRERELQERITNAQRQFRDRNQIIQQAAQYGLSQIERTLVSVIRQVAESRGMNLVLHRAQVALNVNEFDITDQVAEQLNKVLPSVQVPPDGVPLAKFAPAVQAAAQASQAATQAATPPAPAPAPRK